MDMMPFSYKSRQVKTQGGEWAKRHGSKFVPQQVRGPLQETECGVQYMHVDKANAISSKVR